MNYVLMPSLGHIARVKITVMLWNQDDIKTRITNYSSLLPRNKYGELLLNVDNNKHTREWLEVEEQVFRKVTQLKLPECLKKKLFGVVKPIGWEMLKWIKNHDRCINGKSHLLPINLCWTSVGKIDKKKSAEVLIKDKSIYIAARYILACVHCLEDDVREVWNSMPRNLKAYFYSEELVLDDEVNQLVVFWTYYLKKKLAKLTDKINCFISREIDFMAREMSPYKFGFLYAVKSGNKSATEYFLKKLNPAEREECFMNYECDADHGDLLCFLLSQMNKEEQIKYFSKYSMNTCNVLRCLLEWPLQSFFKETFVTLCELDLLPAMEFYVMLEDIVKKISKDIMFMDYDYQELLEQIWQLSPDIYKQYVFYYWAELVDVPLVDDMTYKGNIMLILKDAPIDLRERIIFKHKRYIISLILEYKWDLIKLLMQECISSTEMMMKFKCEFITECKKFFKGYCNPESKFERYALNKISQLMDELINKKRKLVEGECSQAKRPHIIRVAKSNM